MSDICIYRNHHGVVYVVIYSNATAYLPEPDKSEGVGYLPSGLRPAYKVGSALSWGSSHAGSVHVSPNGYIELISGENTNYYVGIVSFPV